MHSVRYLRNYYFLLFKCPPNLGRLLKCYIHFFLLSSVFSLHFPTSFSTFWIKKCCRTSRLTFTPTNATTLLNYYRDAIRISPSVRFLFLPLKMANFQENYSDNVRTGTRRCGSARRRSEFGEGWSFFMDYLNKTIRLLAVAFLSTFFPVYYAFVYKYM